jgi:hypothetical protein
MDFIRRCARDNLRGQKSLGPLKMSLEMAHKVIEVCELGKVK